MTQHPRAKLGLAGRHELVRAVEGGAGQREAAARFCVSVATANKWWRRWRDAAEADRRGLACLRDRSSRPHRSPAELPATEQDRICEVRERTGWGPRLIASEVGHPHSTVHRTLWRRGCSRRPRAPREAVLRYEWPCPGNLLHMDTKRCERFAEPGHAAHGDRRRRTRGAGHEWVH